MPAPLNILFLASEADPFIKIGGLGDVAGSLPYALRDLDSSALDVRLVIPFHPAIRSENFDIQRETTFTIPRGSEDVPVQVFRVAGHSVPVYLISGDPITGSSSVYDPDPIRDGEKYVFFSLAALELARRIDWRPDIVHANDWHTALAAYAVRSKQSDPFWEGVKTVLSVHNLGFMGQGSQDALWAYGLPPLEDWALPSWAHHVPLPMGLWAADAIVAVSPSYAQEIQTPEYGCGLDNFLSGYRGRIAGIVNGIDYAIWDSSKDDALVAPFTFDALAPRVANKSDLQARLGLPVDAGVPLLAMITRMDQQKGVDIALDALRLIADLSWQAAILGTGNAELENAARRLEMDFPDRARAILRFDAKLSRQIYGGSDALLMPSRYEPCGLAQMIAMRYGCVPIARATGGLRDTIAEGRTGFLFTEASPNVMSASLRRALPIYQDREKWQGLQKSAMQEDFSWRQSARQYFKLYQSLVKP
jgi:starch synthase